MSETFGAVGKCNAGHPFIDASSCLACLQIRSLRSALAKAVRTLEMQAKRWQDIPMGIDEDADENDKSPEDATAHIGGLAVKEIAQALAEIKELGE